MHADQPEVVKGFMTCFARIRLAAFVSTQTGDLIWANSTHENVFGQKRPKALLKHVDPTCPDSLRGRTIVKSNQATALFSQTAWPLEDADGTVVAIAHLLRPLGRFEALAAIETQLWQLTKDPATPPQSQLNTLLSLGCQHLGMAHAVLMTQDTGRFDASVEL